MRASFKRVGFLFVAGVLMGSGAIAAGLLDGKTFEGQCIRKGKAESSADDLVFKDGKFLSTACVKYGFSEAPYTTKKDGDTIVWDASTVSATEGKMLWKGTIKGDLAEASFTWVKTGSDAQEWTFKGKLKKK